jgi:hypothetical protein
MAGSKDPRTVPAARGMADATKERRGGVTAQRLRRTGSRWSLCRVGQDVKRLPLGPRRSVLDPAVVLAELQQLMPDLQDLLTSE